ncbi:MAG: tRNA lysidine(34) synthetase TilS [Elusimicrobiota bacterium]
MPPAPKRLLSRLAAFDRAEGLLSRGDRVLVAVSGGPDSVCLAHRLSRLAARRRLIATVLHMHHGLRGRGADRDAVFAERLARQLGLPFVLERLPVSELASRERRSLEDAGRRLRYRALAACARRLGCDKAATGHHLDDQAETLLLHLLRGTKAKGLAGIPPKRVLREGAGRGVRRVQLIRPLLVLSRAEVLAYCRAYGLRYRKDPTNRSTRFTRNWVRLKVLPLLERRNPRIREHLAAIAQDIRARLR